MSGQLKDAEKQLADQQALMQEQNQRWQHQQEQEQAWFARRILEEKQFVEEKSLEKMQRLQQQVAVLTESEAALQQLCASLVVSQSLAKGGECLFWRQDYPAKAINCS